jgi:ectoine hydroxylase-related dioxygenase (phytanoyl-CoA dioxygenase family)
MDHHPDVTDETIEAFARDGVVLLRQVLDRTWMELVDLGIERNLRNPGPHHQHHYEGTPRAFVDDYCNYWAVPEYRMLVEHSPIASIVASILGSERLWLFYEQIFVKDAPTTEARRTPWHQDTTYWITGGRQLAGFWITVDDTPAEESLEFVRGSHLGPTFAGTAFDYRDETTPFAAASDGFARIPDIEADRGAFDIVSFPIERGDVVLFHPGLLHGGGATEHSRPRRTLSIRFFGDDVVYEPPARPAPRYPGTAALLEPGDPLRGPWFPQVWPRSECSPTTPGV